MIYLESAAEAATYPYTNESVQSATYVPTRTHTALRTDSEVDDVFPARWALEDASYDEECQALDALEEAL